MRPAPGRKRLLVKTALPVFREYLAYALRIRYQRCTRAQRPTPVLRERQSSLFIEGAQCQVSTHPELFLAAWPTYLSQIQAWTAAKNPKDFLAVTPRANAQSNLQGSAWGVGCKRIIRVINAVNRSVIPTAGATLQDAVVRLLIGTKAVGTCTMVGNGDRGSPTESQRSGKRVYTFHSSC